MKREVRIACTTMGFSTTTLVNILELWNVLPAAYCGQRYLQWLLLLLERLEGATTSIANTYSWTKLWWLHYDQPEHVSACLGSATLRGGYDDGSILRLTRDDWSSDKN